MRGRQLRKPEIEMPGKLLLEHREGAAVCTLELPLSGGFGIMRECVRDTIAALAQWTQEQGGLVGHIKASLQTGSGTVVYSCTGDGVYIREYPDTGSLLTLVVIAFFVDDLALKKWLEQWLEGLPTD